MGRFFFGRSSCVDRAPMNRDFVNMSAFVLGVCIAFALLVPQARAAAVAVPAVSGYSSGFFSAPAGTYTTAANAASYGASGVISVGGKPITVPATMRMASNAGQYAKNMMRLNPGLLVGTAAAAWLLDQGLEYIDGQWMSRSPSYTNYGSSYGGVGTHPTEADLINAILASQRVYNPTIQFDHIDWTSDTFGQIYLSSGWGNVWRVRIGTVSNPATDDDFDGLPDPLPAVAPELPSAPYMPEGVPVEKPKYDFVPMRVPVGEPYTKPDGSTAQPKSVISPNGESVTVDTYEEPLTDPQGNPVPDPVPTDTPEPTPGHCEQFPNSLGCLPVGEVPTEDNLPTEDLPVADIQPVSVGGAGSCPAPLVATVAGMTIEWPLDQFCTFANALRPVVLSLAWLAAGVLFISGVRNG